MGIDLAILDQRRAQMQRLLSEFLGIPSRSGEERIFVEKVAEWATGMGFVVDLFESDEHTLAAAWAPLPETHTPLAGRPTLVLRLPGAESKQKLMFNAHSDVVSAPAPQHWSFGGPWSGHFDGSLVFGRGACDVKGGLISALWAMLICRDFGKATAKADSDRGEILLELIPGEEDTVGLGTLTSIARGYRSDGVIVLEPTELQPCRASRSGYRFLIDVIGTAVHGTVKWRGVDAIGVARKVLSALETLEQRWNSIDIDPLFSRFPFQRPITPDVISGGAGQGMLCDHCIISGYVDLLPLDDLRFWKLRIETELKELLTLKGITTQQWSIHFTEEYAGHQILETDRMCTIANEVIAESRNLNVGPALPGIGAFNAGCEAGERASRLGTPTLVWGPGSLDQAHGVDEFIAFEQVRSAAWMFADFALRWTSESKPGRVV